MRMGKNYEDAKARCPFYQTTDAGGHKIKCEGILGADSIILCYNGKRDRQRVRDLKTYCQAGYADCPVYRMIEKDKYSV